MKKLIDKLKHICTNQTERPLARWSTARLNNVKAYLESKDPLLWSREDHYLSVEFVLQRYLPADEHRTQAEYEAALKGMTDKIDRNLDNPDFPREEIKDDPDFAAWLDQHLKS